MRVRHGLSSKGPGQSPVCLFDRKAQNFSLFLSILDRLKSEIWILKSILPQGALLLHRARQKEPFRLLHHTALQSFRRVSRLDQNRFLA